MTKNKDYVSITKDEYEELIECKTKVNLLFDYVFGAQKDFIMDCGLRLTTYNAELVNNILGSGYINQNIESYMKAYKQKRGEKTK